MDVAIFVSLFLLLVTVYFLLTKKTSSRRLPPGSLGLPIIGQSLSFLRALHNNTAEEWLRDRTRKYGAISKMSLFGTTTLFLQGQAANKFIYTCDSNVLATQQPASIRRTFGENNIMELSGEEHKRIRGALVSFLKPEVLKQYVGKMDQEVRNHFKRNNWHGNHKLLSAMPSMKTLTFSVLTSLIFGMEDDEEKKRAFREPFIQFMEGILSIPINFPFTRFNRSLRARAKLKTMIMDMLQEKRTALEERTISPQHDLLSTLLSLQNKDKSAALSDEEIVDNVVVILVAGHDTTSLLLTFLIRILAIDPSTYAQVVKEQEEIAKSKGTADLLTWDDLAKMKYSWRVATECLRITPPVFCSFRKVLQDFEYGGFLIPKGWQLMWSSSMTHMDECIYTEPSKFDATRFEKQAPPYTLIPFGGGARICPGMEFAKIEILVTMHYLVTRFTWKLSNPEDLSFSREPLPTFNRGLQIEIEQKQVI